MTDIRIPIPAEFKGIAPAISAYIDRLKILAAEMGVEQAVDYEAGEISLEKGAGKIELLGHKTLLQRLNVDSPYIRVWGKISVFGVKPIGAPARGARTL